MKDRATNHRAPVSDQAYRRMFGVAQDGIILVDANTGRIEDCNASAARLFRMRRSELSGKQVWQIGFVTGPFVSRAAFGRLGKRPRVSYKYLEVRLANGTRLSLAVTCAFFRDDDRVLVKVNLSDQTAIRRLETELRARDQEYRQIFDGSELGIVMMSLNGRVMRANQSFVRITGYDERELRRLTLADITHPDHRAADRKLLRDALKREGGDHHVEKRYIGKQGEVVWTNTHVSAVFGEDGKPAYLQAFVEDISERRQIEARLAEQNLRATQKEKTIEELREGFVFLAAHELRTPTIAMSWAIDALDIAMARGGEGSETATKETIDILRENTNRLKGLVSELLDVSRIDYGTFKVVPVRFDLGRTVAVAVANVRSASERASISVKIVMEAGKKWFAFADPIRVEQVLVNLLSNAIKYNAPGGTVTVRVKNADGALVVSVTDTGFGLSAKDIPKLFQRFSRIESRKTAPIEGTGLGLFIVKQIVERMVGGRIWVESRGRGYGSTFSFSVPLATTRS